MLHIRSAVNLDDIESVLKAVAHRRNARVTVISHLGQPHHVAADGAREALVFTIYHPKRHASLLAADMALRAFCPAASPRCRMETASCCKL